MASQNRPARNAASGGIHTNRVVECDANEETEMDSYGVNRMTVGDVITWTGKSTSAENEIRRDLVELLHTWIEQEDEDDQFEATCRLAIAVVTRIIRLSDVREVGLDSRIRDEREANVANLLCEVGGELMEVVEDDDEIKVLSRMLNAWAKVARS